MHEDLDLSVIERHHDADPQFREAVRTRLVAILVGSDALDVPDHLPVQSTGEEATMIDLETPSETDDRQQRPKRFLVAGLLAAAAVVAIALVATRADNATPADQPSPTVTAPAPAQIVCEPEGCPWSPELTAQALELPIDCDRSAVPSCPSLAVAPDGTLVAFDIEAATLTWYEDEPRVVPLAHGFGTANDTRLLAIGPHDIAYIAQMGHLTAFAPSGEVITRTAGPFNAPVYPAATGLFRISERWPSPDGEPTMPWVDLDGNPITDTRPYPTAGPTDAGIAVRFGEREWLLPELAESRPGLFAFVDLQPRADGGVVMVLDTYPEETINLLELLPDGTIERYFVDLVSSIRPSTVLPDGSLIVEHDAQLVRLTPPA
jgi:hypothetical protein